MGQAAPVLDDISLSTRELSSPLVVRGFLENLFHHKPDPAAYKVVEEAYCDRIHALTHSQKAYETAGHDMTKEMSQVTGTDKKSHIVQKAYKKEIKEFERLAKKSGHKIKELKASLKKINVTECKSKTNASTSDSNST